MIICDLCKSECLDERKVDIHYVFACKAYQSKEVHMCARCRGELNDARMLAEVEFYDRKVAEATEEKHEKYFSPEQVRAMTRGEVAENHKAIMDSMKKW